MKKLILAGYLLTGCTTVQRTVTPITIAAVAGAIENAASSTRKAARNVRDAQSALSNAEARTSALLKVAAPSERVLLGGIKTSLMQTHTELGATLGELTIARAALTDSEEKADALQTQIDRENEQLRCAEETARREKARAALWKSVALKLSILSVALVLWTFRKPIAALFGVPLV